MSRKRTIGKIAVIFLFYLLISIYFFANFFRYGNIFLEGVLFSVDWLKLLFFMFLYALIPGVPAFILHVKYGVETKWIALAATVIFGLCLIIIFGAAALANDNERLADFAKFALTSAVPVLYCAAFWGAGREAWVAVVPSLIYFASFFLCYAITYGSFSVIFYLLLYFDIEFIFYGDPDPFLLISMLTIVLMSVIFFTWALLCVFISRMVHGFTERLEIKKQQKAKANRFKKYYNNNATIMQKRKRDK